MSMSDILLTILPHDLGIVSFQKGSCSSSLLSQMLKLCFFTDRSSRFLSYAESVHECSLIADTASLSLFPEHSIDQSSGERWRALQISEGAAGFEQMAIVQKITEPLALANISVLFISTYQTDFVLVPSGDLLRAVKCLQQCFNVELDGDMPVNAIDADLSTDHCLQSPALEGELKLHKHKLSIPELKFRLISLPKYSLDVHMHALVQLLFLNEHADDFVSLTETDDEISLITCDPTFIDYATSHNDLVISPNIWRIVQVGSGKLGFTETGIVAGQTKVLSKAGSTIIYLSTFSSDYTMIRVDEWDGAREALREHFEVKEGHFIRFNAELSEHGDTSENKALAEREKAALFA